MALNLSPITRCKPEREKHKQNHKRGKQPHRENYRASQWMIVKTKPRLNKIVSLIVKILAIKNRCVKLLSKRVTRLSSNTIFDSKRG